MDLRLAAWPEIRLDRASLLALAQSLERLVADPRPGTIMLTRPAGDLNFDQRRARQAVVTACRPQLGFPVSTLWPSRWPPARSGGSRTQVWSFSRQRSFDVRGRLERRLEALHTYQGEIRVWSDTHSRRTFKALARWRVSTIGVEADEAVIVQGC